MRGRRAGRTRTTVNAPRQRLQQLARILEVPSPQQRSALAGEVIGGVGRRAVVGDDDAPGGRHAALGAPTGRADFAGLGPADDRIQPYFPCVSTKTVPNWSRSL